MLVAALGQDGIHRAVRFSQTCRLAGADTKHDPPATPPDRLRGLHKALLAVGGIEDDVSAPATGQLRDFGGDVVALVVENVMGAGLPGQCDRLRRAAATDNRSGPQGTRRHLHREMPDAAPTARDIDRVTGLHSPVKTRKSGQEGHRKRRRVAEAQGWRLAGGEELACNGVAAFAASAPARCDPAAITVQIGHGGHRVADLNATHTMAHGDNHASEIKTENDGGHSSATRTAAPSRWRGRSGRSFR